MDDLKLFKIKQAMELLQELIANYELLEHNNILLKNCVEKYKDIPITEQNKEIFYAKQIIEETQV